MDKTSEVYEFCDDQKDLNVSHATFMQKEGEGKGVSPTAANEEQNVMPYEKFSTKMHAPKCEDIDREGLKEATLGYVRQSSMDVVKFESPASQDVNEIVNQKITTHLELDCHVQSSGKMELVVMPQMPRSKHEFGLSIEEADLHVQSQSSLPDSSLKSKATIRSPHPNSTPRRTQKQNADDDYSFEHSPVSPFQGKVGIKGGLLASPFWERKVSSSGTQGFGSATPGRRQPNPITHREDDNGPTIPKFGDWDESNPSASEGFTQVFDQVREQRQNGGGTSTGSTNGPSSHYRQAKFEKKSSEGCCCFRWGKS